MKENKSFVPPGGLLPGAAVCSKHIYLALRRIPKGAFFGGLAKMMMILLLFGWAGSAWGQSSNSNFCGTYKALPPNGTNPDSLVYDRFGNAFDFDDLLVPPPPPPPPSGPSAACNSGYFNPTFVGEAAVPQNVQDVVCEVLGYVASVVRQRQGTTSCGSLPAQKVDLQVVWISFSDPDEDFAMQMGIDLPLPGGAAATGSPHYSQPFDPSCNEVALDRPFIKVNGGKVEGVDMFDGRLLLNADNLPWNYNTTATTFSGMDMFTVTLHEVMHIMGYASRMASNDAFTLWDQTLRVVDEYMPSGGSTVAQSMIETTVSGCTRNCWTRANSLSLPTNSCSGLGQDVVVGDAALAPIAGNPAVPPGPNTDEERNAFNNMLSHLSTTCSGQNVPYVMRPGFLLGQSQRQITEPEQQIFCALGYLVESPQASCSGCYNIAHPDGSLRDPDFACCYQVFHGCAGQTIEILDNELLCNDISNSSSPHQVVRIWPVSSQITSLVHITRNNAGTGWNVIIDSGAGSQIEFRYTTAGCDCRMHNGRLRIYVEQQCPPCTYSSDPCENLLCYEDFENFTNTNSIMTWLGWPFLFQNDGGIQTPDLNFANGNHYLFLGALDSDHESVTMQLQECIPSGCSLTLNIELATFQNNAFLEVWGSTRPPCRATDAPAVPISKACGSPTSCSSTNIFNPLCIGSLPVANTLTSSNPNDVTFIATNHITYTWLNNTNESVCFLTLVPGNYPVFLDNITAVRRCHPTLALTTNAPAEACAGGTFNLTYTICATSIPGSTTTLVTPQLDLPPGWQLVGGNLSPFSMTAGQCTTLTLQVSVPANAVIGSMPPITFSGTAAGVCDQAEFSSVVMPEVIDCALSAFTCPCTEANTLNIDATSSSPLYSPAHQGVLWSDYVQANNLPTNLGLPEHHGCIAIAGRLIMDQDAAFASCPEIRMQPCAEIVVGTVPVWQHNPAALSGPTFTVSSSRMFGCEKMWRGIRVTPRSRLVMLENFLIADAEFSVLAQGVPVSSPTELPTRIQIVGNTFSRNHVAVGATGEFLEVVHHKPFIYNTFTGRVAGQPLLPPCTPGLAHYNQDIGYAGVLALGVAFSVGEDVGSAYTNTFQQIRNGVIGERAHLEVHHADFIDIADFWDYTNAPPSFAAGSAGVGVLANAFTTAVVKNCSFDQVRRAVYSNALYLTVTDNFIPSVDVGVTSIGARKFKIADNEITYASQGVVCRELRPHPFNTGFEVLRNTFNNPASFSGTIPPSKVSQWAVQIENATNTTLKNARMFDNQMLTGSARAAGFTVNNTNNWVIDQNTLHLFGNSTMGIHLTNAYGNRLLTNTVEVTPSGNNIPISSGFYTDSGTGNIFCCNTTTGSNFGHVFFNGCDKTGWLHNIMDQHEYSIYCGEGTKIGPQFSRGNQFLGVTGSSGVAYHGGRLTLFKTRALGC